MAQMIRFPSHPAEPVEVLELDGPEDLSALFCDQFDAVHGQGWTAYLWTDPPRPDAYNATDRNDRAAAFLNAHAADARADWDTFLRGPMVLACRPVLTADPLPAEFAAYLPEAEDRDMLRPASSET